MKPQVHSHRNLLPPILVGCFDRFIWIRVEGKGSFRNSAELKEFADEMMKQGCSTIVVDLEDCPCMDSTFMGTLTGIALHLSGIPGGKLQVVNANARNHQSLKNLGLDQIFQVDVEGDLWRKERKFISEKLVPQAHRELDKEEQTTLVLEAHEALGEADKDNVLRFKDVVSYLREDLKHSLD